MTAYTPLELARAFISTGELDDALEALNAALADDAHAEEALRLRAEVLARRGDPDSIAAALADYARVSQHTVNDALRAAALCQQLGRIDDAHVYLTRALHDHPNDERLTEQRVMLLAQQGDYAAALDAAAQMPPTWGWRARMAELAAAHGDHAAAVEHLTHALEEVAQRVEQDAAFWQAQQVNLLCARGRAYQALSRYTDAQADYQRAAALMPRDPLIAFNLGVLAALQGDHTRGAALCAQAYAQASAALQAEMRAAVLEDPRLTGLVPHRE